MHVQVHCRIMPWKVYVEIPKYLFLDRYRIKQKSEIRMCLEILDVSNIQSPCNFSREVIMRKVKFLKWWIESKDDIFFEGFGRHVVNQVMREIEI